MSRRPFPHGTISGYTRGCSCNRCAEAKLIYDREYRSDDPRLVSRRQAASRIAKLRRKGMSLAAIAECSGLSMLTIINTERGSYAKIRRSTEEAILTVEPVPYKSGSHIPADRTQAILAKARQKRLMSTLARACGYTSASHLPKRNQRRVRARTALLIEDAARSMGLLGDKTSVSVDVARLSRHIGDRPMPFIEQDAGLSRGQVQHVLERGSCSVSTLERLAAALHVREEDLMTAGESQ